MGDHIHKKPNQMSDGQMQRVAIAREINSETSTTEMYNYVSDIQYQYDVPLNTYVRGTDGRLISDMVYEQYELVAGKFPEEANEVVLILDSSNEVSDVAVYALGMMSDDEVNDIFTAVAKKGVRNDRLHLCFDRLCYSENRRKRYCKRAASAGKRKLRRADRSAVYHYRGD